MLVVVYSIWADIGQL